MEAHKLIQFLLLLYWSPTQAIFPVDFSNLQLPKFNFNFENLFRQPRHDEEQTAQPESNRRSYGKRSFIHQIFSTQLPPPTYQSYDDGAPYADDYYISSSERSHELSDDFNSIDIIESEMKSLDAELNNGMKNSKVFGAFATTTAVTTTTTTTAAPRPPPQAPMLRPHHHHVHQNSSLFPDLSVLRQLFQWSGQSARSLAICHACKVGAGLFMLRARGGASEESLLQTAQFGCTFFKIAPDEMCEGLISRFGPVLYYIVMQREHLTADIFCGMILQSAGCSTTDASTDWDVLAGPASPRTDNGRNNNVRKRSPDVEVLTQNGIKTMKILHLTDIHVDPHYVTGGIAECDTEICCRQYDRVAERTGKGAGYYGDYRKCDIPYRTFENALRHISQAHPDIALMYMTGDLVPHNVWSTNADENIQIIRNCSNLIFQYFPNTTIIPVVGNHESHPVNLFSPYGVPSRFSTDWVYSNAVKSWSQWIPAESVATFLHAGFYTVTVRPDFKVIVLNTNLCYTYNFWQLYEDRDPSGQLKWLAHELEVAERLDQKVHIIGHVPPGHEECWSVWSKNFYEIVTRFSSTVRAQFYGHTHFEEFKLFYDPLEPERAVNSIWITGSLTPYTDLNPGYKIFTVDGGRGSDSTYHILDSETFIYNLTEANSYPGAPPRWFKLYRATEAYKLPNLLPQSLHSFVRRMSTNLSDFRLYHKYYYKGSGRKRSSDCDALCRKKHLCDIVTPYSRRQTECMHLQNKLDGVVLPMRVFEAKSPESESSNPASSEARSSSSSVENNKSRSSPSENNQQTSSFFDRIFGSRRFFFGR